MLLCCYYVAITVSWVIFIKIIITSVNNEINIYLNIKVLYIF